MEITYLSNSGFALERNEELLVFDCHNPQKQPLLAAASLRGKSAITVFVSHIHGDHYSPGIWKIPGAQFVVSFDVPVPPGMESAATVLHPGEKATVNGLSIHAYGSTDAGVSFFVHWGDRTIFHAGDLNDWHWRDEGGESYARQEEAKFLQELERIRQFEESPFLAFFPVDPRMGSDYYRGAILFSQTMRPRYFIPMHFGKDFMPPQMFFEEIAPLTELLAPPSLGRQITITV